MKIVKAIEILSELATTLPQSSPEERITAVNLGVAALSRIRYQRLKQTDPYSRYLPGETKN